MQVNLTRAGRGVESSDPIVTHLGSAAETTELDAYNCCVLSASDHHSRERNVAQGADADVGCAKIINNSSLLLVRASVQLEPGLFFGQRYCGR
jgi:hypothetical protein